MIQGRAVIVNSRGLHARPAARLARLANRFDCVITVRKGRRKADAKSVAALLMLAAASGAELVIEADGKDENEAVALLLETIAAGFSDDSVVNNPQQAEAVPLATGTQRKNATYRISGIGVGDTVVLGRAQAHISGAADVPYYRLEKRQLTAEIRRYENAIENVRAEFQALRLQAAALPGGAEITPFVDLYLTFLNDDEFARKPQHLIRRRRVNAEWALKERVGFVNDSFRRVQDSYLRERGRDIEHVMSRLLAAMKSKSGKTRAVKKVAEKNILVASDLDPADVIRIRQAGYEGFILESGSGTSHTAILARSMNMPALVGARGMLGCLQHDNRVILDAEAEIAIINPDAETFARYKKRREKKKAAVRPRQKKHGGQGVLSRDGECVLLETNIDLPGEVDSALQSAADGIGLFRTEFLFIERDELPSEDEQFEIYRHVLSKMAPLPVVIRTLDLGGEKMSAAVDERLMSANPALGVRAIRYCLAMPEIFLTQLRALLRAGAACHNLRLLLPMLSHPLELEKTVELLWHAREQLRVTRNLTLPPPQVGGMIEVPAAVFIMRALASELRFFSIGTNDLIQYTMAVDRNNETLLSLYDPLHPAVLNLLAKIVTDAGRMKRPVTLCGELAGDPQLTRLILALGLRRLSMNVSGIDAVRQVIQDTDCKALAGAVRHILRAPSPTAARAVLDKMNSST